MAVENHWWWWWWGIRGRKFVVQGKRIISIQQAHYQNSYERLGKKYSTLLRWTSLKRNGRGFDLINFNTVLLRYNDIWYNDICDIAIFFSPPLFFRRNLTIYAILRLSLIFSKYRYNIIIIMIESSLIKSFTITFNIDIAIVITSSLSKPF